jgi:hypothetical protein
MIKNQLTKISSILFAVVILFGACTFPDTKPTKRATHVILIGVDGMSPDGVKHGDTPILDQMMKAGAHSKTARAVLPSSSGANWASMLNGAGPEQHGVISNSWRTDNFILPATVVNERNKFPTIFSVIRKQLPESKLGAIYHWGPIVNFFEESDVDYSISPNSEEETANLAAEFIQENKPEFTFIHLDHVDGAGHGFGHGTQEYYEAVSKADSLIGIIVQATKDAGIFDDTIFIVSSDHGGLGKGHGGPSIAEMGIPWIISGKNIKPEFLLDFPINTYDSPTTVLFALGLEIPFEWIGRPVNGAFVGEEAPKVMFTMNAAMLNPVIEPQSVDGFTPAGGLFIGESAELKISNPNDRGEIRYTLDGSLPSIESPIFSENIMLDQTTVVRAQIFSDDTPISQTETAFFRVLNNPTGHGVRYTTYQKDYMVMLPNFSSLEPVGTGTTMEIDLVDIMLPREEAVAAVFEGFLEIEVAGNYRFYLASDDGSKLYINDALVVDNDGDHGVIEKDASETLEVGMHALRVEWFNGGGGKWLGLFYEGPGIAKQLVPADKLYIN